MFLGMKWYIVIHARSILSNATFNKFVCFVFNKFCLISVSQLFHNTNLVAHQAKKSLVILEQMTNMKISSQIVTKMWRQFLKSPEILSTSRWLLIYYTISYIYICVDKWCLPHVVIRSITQGTVRMKHQVRLQLNPIIPSVRRIPNFINLKPGDCDYGIGNYHMNYWTDHSDHCTDW